MGVLNVTPDSFSDGGRFLLRERAVEQGFRMAREGADILDVGGESTRPYAEEISEQEELDRVIPVIESLRRELRLPISIDTLKAGVAREALRAGASMVNDVSALRFDPELARVAAEAGVPVVLMHMKGTPRDMQDHPAYEDLFSEIIAFLSDAAERATRSGVREDLIILDPGIGFGKTFDHNLLLLRELGKFSSLGRPLLVGPSRKAFLGRILNKEAPQRDTGTMAAVAAAALGGIHIVRVHNVGMAVETVKVIDAIRRGRVEQGNAELGARNAE
ncbi:MAG: dihydropteroate synthase [Deltaproteobacteria bacterium]|nr:dihydropteroate synthase [Deltaproteobacteria bacterium]